MQSAAAPPNSFDIPVDSTPAQDNSAVTPEDAAIATHPALPFVAQPFPQLDQNNCQLLNTRVQEIIMHGLAGFPMGSGDDTLFPHQFFNMPIARGSAYHTFAVSVLKLLLFRS